MKILCKSITYSRSEKYQAESLKAKMLEEKMIKENGQLIKNQTKKQYEIPEGLQLPYVSA